MTKWQWYLKNYKTMSVLARLKMWWKEIGISWLIGAGFTIVLSAIFGYKFVLISLLVIVLVITLGL